MILFFYNITGIRSKEILALVRHPKFPFREKIKEEKKYPEIIFNCYVLKNSGRCECVFVFVCVKEREREREE